MRNQWVVIAALVLACDAASPQIADTEEPQPDAYDIAWDSGREPYRGHYPFSVAGFRPFGEPDWFVVSFFTYWTGYLDTRDARQHWVVRKVAGRFEGYDEEGQPTAEEPAHVAFASSHTCSSLERALSRFELHERPEFNGGEGPTNSDDVVVISSYDTSWLHFWVRLTTAEIQLSTSVNDSGASAWVFETMDAISGCFSDITPDVPTAAHADNYLARPPTGVFARWWEEQDEAELP